MGSINAGDTAWVLISSALVLMMTPALAFFYGGMVRKKNVLSTLNLSFIMIGADQRPVGALSAIPWPLARTWVASSGGLDFLGLSGVGAEPTADVCADHPPPGFCRFPDDVCHHHPGV